MKLRNKKTGEIIDGLQLSVSEYSFGEWMQDWSYQSIEKLQEEWEDYKEKEPLIKDEKVRNVVRAWADLFGYKFVTHRYYTTVTGHKWSLLSRESQEICLPDIEELEESKDYTIAELCGEKEE